MEFLGDSDKEDSKGAAASECDPNGEEGESDDDPGIVSPEEPSMPDFHLPQFDFAKLFLEFFLDVF